MNDEQIMKRAVEIVEDAKRTFGESSIQRQLIVEAIAERAFREGLAMHERDAARLDWLIDQMRAIDFYHATGELPGTPEANRAAIDAAMLARN